MRTTYKFFAAVILATLLLTGCSQNGQSMSLGKDKLSLPSDHWTTTDDGWSLHILHYAPANLDPTRPPVVLCHGLSHNNTFWDLDKKVSLAKYLQSQGYDVWSASLRGCGQSTKPTISNLKQLFRLNVSAFNPKGVVNRQPGILRYNWTVDDHINHDVPAILDYVTKNAPSKQVYWIGHSMGAMIMFAYLGMHPEEQHVKGFIAVSGPMYLQRPSNDVFELMAREANFVKIGNLTTGTNLRAVVGTMAGNMVSISIDQLFLNPDNVDPRILRIFYYANQDDISPGQLDQLLQYVQTGNFIGYDGKTNYTEMLGKIKVPVLQVVGRLDNMVDPGYAVEVNRRLGSCDKKVRIFGRINGYRADYGHDDIIIGKFARDDVFPYMRDWLNAQSSTGNKFQLIPVIKQKK